MRVTYTFRILLNITFIIPIDVCLNNSTVMGLGIEICGCEFILSKFSVLRVQARVEFVRSLKNLHSQTNSHKIYSNSNNFYPAKESYLICLRFLHDICFMKCAERYKKD